MKFIVFLLFILPVILFGQPTGLQKNGSGIQWAQYLSWEEIFEKAKNEQKYIFIDCYTTWCGPCRLMDSIVYVDKEVGQLFMDKFISIKVQMDKTKKDNIQVKNWYKIADSISKIYRIRAFPSLIFLSPNGNIVKKVSGYKNVNDFISIAKSSLIDDKDYLDQYAVFDSLVIEYNNGKRNYNVMLYMIKTAKELGDLELVNELSTEYYKMLQVSKESELYSKANIEFIASNIKSAKDKLFRLFYPDARKVNTLMGRETFARSVIDRVIQLEIINPLVKSKPSDMEPDWDYLNIVILKKFRRSFADRNVLDLKRRWYLYQLQSGREQFKDLYIESNIKYINGHIDTTDLNNESVINGFAYDIIFKLSTDTSQIKLALKWMEGVIRRTQNSYPFFASAAMDTYANLLYKLGQVDSAIEWEKKAITLAKTVNTDWAREKIQKFDKIINLMKNNVPTWPPHNR